tara:strand:+ start:22987 stop:24102 length:1116 start_codon:yes stop_codon:yes gene_type:complete
LKNKILVISAHRGSTSWQRMLKSLNSDKEFEVSEFYSFNDNDYRTTDPVKRILIRIKTFIFFPLKIFFKSKKYFSSFSKIIVVTSPFFLPYIVLRKLYNKQIIVLYNDLYPNALEAKKIIRQGGIISKFIKRMNSYSFERASNSIFINEALLEYCLNNYKTLTNYKIINVPAHSNSNLDNSIEKNYSKIDLIYSGTLGYLHDPRLLIKYLYKNKINSKLKFTFITSGVRKLDFEKEINKNFSKEINEKKIELLNPLDDKIWEKVMLKSHIGIVFQDQNANDVLFPSKVASMLVSGQAILAITSKSSYLGKLIINNDLGWVAENFENLELAFDELSSIKLLKKKIKNAYLYGINNFSYEKIYSKWKEILLAK